MQRLKAEGYCGEQHTLDELNKCGHCRKYREIWNAAIEAAAKIITRLNREGPYQAITGATEIRKLKK